MWVIYDELIYKFYNGLINKQINNVLMHIYGLWFFF